MPRADRRPCRGPHHRDIKPQNLILTAGGAVKLLDFGIAVDVGGAGPEGQAASPKELALRGFAAFGTPEYMAPEQVRGAAIDARADVYALGCVLYEMLVGAPPFDGSPVVVMGKQIRDTPTPPCLRAPERTIPSALEAVVLRAIAKDPEQRFASAAAMCTALEEARAIPEGRRPRVQRAARPPPQPVGGPPTQRLAGVADSGSRGPPPSGHSVCFARGNGGSDVDPCDGCVGGGPLVPTVADTSAPTRKLGQRRRAWRWATYSDSERPEKPRRPPSRKSKGPKGLPLRTRVS